MAHLLEPLRVASMTLANRLIMPPMGTQKADPDGKVTSELVGVGRAMLKDSGWARRAVESLRD